MDYDFDCTIDRRSRPNINKWSWHPEGVLPLWIADMDFRASQPILDALHEAVEHGVFGYELASASLLELVSERMQRLYGWKFAAEAVVPVPGVNAGYRVAAAVACSPGEGVIVQPPVFYDFIPFPAAYGLRRQDAPLLKEVRGQRIEYRFDPDSFLRAIHSGGSRTGMFLLCNPHNPTGTIFSRADLHQMERLCAANGIVICSDDIHQELTLGAATYIPLAGLSLEIADRSITLIGPGKSFNISGLGCAFAIVPNPALREKYRAEAERLDLYVSSLALAAARAAYSSACDDWLSAVRNYLRSNRDYLFEFVTHELPAVKTTVPDATYLAWLDFNELIRSGKIKGRPGEFLLDKARVALSEGETFGPGGEGFARLNFACPRAVLEEGLQRIQRALTR